MRDADRQRRSDWRRLGLGLLGLAGWIATVHLLSPRLPGDAGAVFRANRDHGVEAAALIYTESGDVADYLDREHGRYSGRWMEEPRAPAEPDPGAPAR